MKMKPEKLIPTMPTYLEGLPLEFEGDLSPGIAPTREEIQAILEAAAAKIGKAHARGEQVPEEYLESYNELYKRWRTMMTGGKA